MSYILLVVGLVALVCGFGWWLPVEHCLQSRPAVFVLGLGCVIGAMGFRADVRAGFAMGLWEFRRALNEHKDDDDEPPLAA